MMLFSGKGAAMHVAMRPASEYSLLSFLLGKTCLIAPLKSVEAFLPHEPDTNLTGFLKYATKVRISGAAKDWYVLTICTQM